MEPAAQNSGFFQSMALLFNGLVVSMDPLVLDVTGSGRAPPGRNLVAVGGLTLGWISKTPKGWAKCHAACLSESRWP